MEGDVGANPWACMCGGRERGSGLADRNLENNQISGSLPAEISMQPILRYQYDAAHLVQCAQRA